MKINLRRLSLCLLCVVAACNPQSSSTTVNVDIYVVRDLQERVAYVLGSTHAHTSRVNTQRLRERLRSLAVKPKGIKTETVTEVSLAQIKDAILPSDKSIYDIVDSSRHEAIKDLFRIFRKYRVDHGWPLESMHPAMLVPIYIRFTPSGTPPDNTQVQSTFRVPKASLDAELERFARSSGWMLASIEDSTQLFTALTSGEPKSYADCLVQYGDYLATPSRWGNYETLKRRRTIAFEKQDIDESAMAATAFFSTVLGCDLHVATHALTQRNRAMAKIVLDDFETQNWPWVYAPGLSHLGGDFGVLNLLRQSGLHVQKLD